MKPLDPRLLVHARATRGFLVASVLIGSLSALLLVAQAFLIASAITLAFQDGANVSELTPTLVALGGVAVGRAVLSWAAEVIGHRSAASATSQLRMQVTERALRLGPAFLGGRGVGDAAGEERCLGGKGGCRRNRGHGVGHLLFSSSARISSRCSSRIGGRR